MITDTWLVWPGAKVIIDSAPVFFFFFLLSMELFVKLKWGGDGLAWV